MKKPPIRLVIADDLQLQREMVKLALETSERFEVVGEAADGQQLVEVTHDLRPDMVITDLNMPEMSGAQAIRGLSFVMPEVVFVVFSSETDDVRLRECLSVGASEVLRKPLQMSRLAAVLEEIFDREAPRKRPVEEDAPPPLFADFPMVAVVGAQAGAGASTLATSLAVGLTAKRKGPVGLMDLDLQTAAATRYMGLGEGKDLLSLLQEVDAVNAEVVEPYLRQSHGVPVLAGPPFPLDQARRDPTLLVEVAAALACRHPLVLDLEPRVDDANRALLRLCTRVLLVVPNSRADIEAAVRWLAVYRHSMGTDLPLRMIYCQRYPDGVLTRESLENRLGSRAFAAVAHDPGAADAAVVGGRPPILDENSRLGRSHRDLVLALCEDFPDLVE